MVDESDEDEDVDLIQLVPGDTFQLTSQLKITEKQMHDEIQKRVMSTSTSQIYQDPDLLNIIEDPIFGQIAERESESGTQGVEDEEIKVDEQ